MDKATLRTSMNPAFRPARGFVAIPAAGSVSAMYASNGMALGDLFYRTDGRLVTLWTRRFLLNLSCADLRRTIS